MLFVNPAGREEVERTDVLSRVLKGRRKMKAAVAGSRCLIGVLTVVLSVNALAQGPTNVNMTVTNNATIDWLWATQYLAVASAAANGTVSGQTNDWIDLGSNVTVQANANPNCHFTYWTGVPDGVTNSNPAVFVMDTFYTNMMAFFALDVKTVTVTTAYGTAVPGTTNVPYGFNLNESIVPTAVTTTPGRVRVRVKGVKVTGNDYTVSP